MSHYWRNRRVFVTGATGILGSWLCKDLIANEAYLVALVRDFDPQSEFFRSGDYRRASIVNGEVEDFRTLERAINEHEIDTVFHLAAQPIVGVAYRFPLQTFESNVRGTYNLLEACRIHHDLVKRIVVASSDKAYGMSFVLPYTEDMPLIGQQPYEVSKSCADLIARSYHTTYELPVAVARCGNIYGGGDLNWNRIVPGTIRACLEGGRPVVRSDGTYVRDYLYVKDACSAFICLADRLDDPNVRGSAFNFSPEQPINVLDLVDRIARLMNCAHLLPDVQNTVHMEIRSQYLDSSKARKVLGWGARYPLDNALVETIDWYREFLNSIMSFRGEGVGSLR